MVNMVGVMSFEGVCYAEVKVAFFTSALALAKTECKNTVIQIKNQCICGAEMRNKLAFNKLSKNFYFKLSRSRQLKEEKKKHRNESAIMNHSASRFETGSESVCYPSFSEKQKKSLA